MENKINLILLVLRELLRDPEGENKVTRSCLVGQIDNKLVPKEEEDIRTKTHDTLSEGEAE